MKKIIRLLSINYLLICAAVYSQPTISSFSPTFGPISEVVNISGANFNSISSNNIVYFGSTRATVNSASATNLNVTVPFGATFDFISVTDQTTNLTAHSTQPFLVTFPFCGAIDSAKFEFTIEDTTATLPNFGCIGDIDGDGKSDAILPNYWSDLVSIYLNTSAVGDISFSTPVNFDTDAGPYSAATGDLNGDGKLDLIVTNQMTALVLVYKNTSSVGAISFDTPISYATAMAPQMIALNDFDGDGKTDFVVSNTNSHSVSVYLNTTVGGIISFAPKMDFFIGAGAFPSFVTVADIDGDYKVDIVTSNPGSTTFSIFLNTSIIGVISFATPVNFSTGTNATSIALGDLDGDQKPDVALSRAGGVSVILNTSTIGIVSFDAPINLITEGATAYRIAIGDLNGDGRLDLVAAYNQQPTWISLFENFSSTGSLSFSAFEPYHIAGTGQLASLSIGDIDNNGTPDIIVGAQNVNEIGVFRNLCTSPILENPTSFSSSTVFIYSDPITMLTTIFFGNEMQNVSLKIIDLSGNEVKQATFSGKQFILETETLHKGIYFIQLISEDNISVVKKIVIE